MLTTSKYAFEEDEIEILKDALIDAIDYCYENGYDERSDAYEDILNTINSIQDETSD